MTRCAENPSPQFLKSPLHIYFNRISSHFSYFWDRFLLLLNGTSYWNAVFCKMIFEILRWTWFGKKSHQSFWPIDDVIITSLGHFSPNFFIFSPQNSVWNGTTCSIWYKIWSEGRPDQLLRKLISKTSYQPLLWRHFRRFLAKFLPKRPKCGV